MNLADLVAERGVLGGLMLQPQMLPDALEDGLTAISFAAPGHAATFGAMVRVGSDAMTDRPMGAVWDELTRAGDLRLLGPNGRELVTMMLEALPAPLVQPAWGRLVALASGRCVMFALREAANRIERDPGSASEVLAALQQRRQ